MSSREIYARKLRQFIDETPGVLLDAREYFPDDPDDGVGPAFELSSGRHQRQFLTLWELFVHGQEFDTCLKHLAERTDDLFARRPYSVILTCTETGKCLAEHLHARLNTGQARVEVQYLGHYPHLGMENQATLDLQGKSVLILTDVVARGDLVREMAEVVEDRGGTAVAALAVAVIDADLITQQEQSDKPPLLAYGSAGRRVPVHSLTDYVIPELSAGEFDPKQVLKIDPVTVLPKEQIELSERFPAAFDVPEMYAHLEAAGALDFGLFEVDGRRFTTAVRIYALLQEKGVEIWKQIAGRLNDRGLFEERDVVLATTFGREDMRFKAFIEECWPSGCPQPAVVFIPARDSLASSKSYFLLHKRAEELQGKHVVLLLASVHTAERLSNLSSLIASQSVESITAVCLLNRLGPDTDGFVSRIERLLGGLGTIESNHTRFHFVPIYTLADLRSDDLASVHATVEGVLKRYRTATRVPGFQRWVDRALVLGGPRSTSAPAFTRGKPMPLREPVRLQWDESGAVEAHSYEGLLSILCTFIVAKRDYRPLMREIGRAAPSGAMFKLLLILLTDVSYLKSIGAFETIRETLFARLYELREHRLRAERAPAQTDMNDLQLRSIVDQEMDVLLVIAGFAHLDERFDYSVLVQEAVDCCMTPGEWFDRPRNLSHYHGYDRVAWSISMLMHLGCWESLTADAENANGVVAKVGATVIGIIDGLDGFGGEESPTGEEDEVPWTLNVGMRQKIKTNLEWLLAEVGPTKHREKHQLIRFLHSRVITIPRRHSSIDNGLTDAFTLLERTITEPNAAVVASKFNRLVRLPSDGSGRLHVNIVLEEAVQATVTLQEVADVLGQWLYITPTRRSELARFDNTSADTSFAGDISALGDFFQDARTNGTIWVNAFERAMQVKNTVLFDLWDKHSYLRKELLRYVVPIRPAVEDSLQTADRMLTRIDFPGIWSAAAGLERCASVTFVDEERLEREGFDWEVLIDQQLLKEILKNLFYNVRHILRRVEKPEDGFGQLVDAEFRVEEAPAPSREPGEVEYVVLAVSSRGAPCMSEMLEKAAHGSTFAHHALQVAEFGGSLELRELPDSGGSQAILRLISRRTREEPSSTAGASLTNGSAL